MRGTYVIATSVRLTTVHAIHPNVHRDRITTTITRITCTGGCRLSFPVVTAVGKRALRGRSRDGLVGDNSVLLLSTNTRARVKCTNSVSSAVPTSTGFAAHRHRVCSVRITTRRTTITTLHPNVPFISMCRLSYGIVVRNLGRLNFIGNSPVRTIETNTRTVFVPYNLKRVVKLSIRSVRGLNRICIKCSNRPGDARFKHGSLHLKHGLRPNFILAVRPNICFVPRLVSL